MAEIKTLTINGKTYQVEGFPPYISERNTWMVYDTDEDSYVDTGITALGYTPVKGEDYYTEEEKAQLISQVIAGVTPEAIGATPDGLNAEDIQVVTSNDDLDSAIATAYNSMADYTVKFKTIHVNASGLSLNGGSWQFVINRSTADYGIVYGVNYNRGRGFVFRVLSGGTWGDWQDFYPSNFAPAGYGLGVKTPPTVTGPTELDACHTCGFYRYVNSGGSSICGIGFNFAGLVVYPMYNDECVQELRPLTTNYCLRRNWYNGSWSEWEIENPPMVAGVEYRTRERYNGKPVYCILVRLSTLPNNTVKTINFSSEADTVIRPIAITGTYGVDESTQHMTLPSNSHNGQLSNQVSLSCVNYRQVRVITNFDASPYVGFATVKYWKTTD